jgi:predicted SAM-dependent methyltransferase
MLIIEIGVGERRVYENSVCVDIRRTSLTDVIADVRYLPFKDESFDKIFSSHVIEHFSHREVKTVLCEWLRILKNNGEIEIRCPDLRARSFLFALRPSLQDIENIYGKQDYTENYHKCGFSFNLLREMLTDCGIVNVMRIWDGYKGIPFIPSDLHIKGKKSIIK